MAGEAVRPQAQQAFDVGSWPAIRQSAAMLSRNRDAFVRQLHYDITSLTPELAGPQAPDMWGFCERMAQSLLWVALTDQPLGVVADTLRKVGGQNWADGFPDTQYPTIAHALVQTVHYLSGGDWSASTGSMWIGYFMWIKPHLLAGAQQAAAQYAAAQQEAERQAAADRAFAEREAARVAALSGDSRGQHTNVVSDDNIESAGSPPDDEEDADVRYGQLMVSMTRNQRRAHRRHTSLASCPRITPVTPATSVHFTAQATTSRVQLPVTNGHAVCKVHYRLQSRRRQARCLVTSVAPVGFVDATTTFPGLAAANRGTADGLMLRGRLPPQHGVPLAPHGPDRYL